MICDLYLDGSSDHHGLELKFHPIDMLKRSFKFRNTCMDLEGHKELVIKCWMNKEVDNTSLFRLNQKLKLVMSSTKQWMVNQLSLKQHIEQSHRSIEVTVASLAF